MSLEELLLYSIALVVTAAVLIVIYFYKLRGREKQPLEVESPKKPNAVESWRIRAKRSVSPDEAKQARNELRILGLEREILSDAIRSLYEAHAEGKITQEERETLAKRYKSRMMKIKDAISEDESIVALHELEAMQNDLVKLFDERFSDLNLKIDSLRSQIGLEAEEEITPTPIVIPRQMESPEKAQLKRPRTQKKTPQSKSAKPRKTPAEERLEKIRAEVEKVLDRLEQMEVEA